jgi:hypothetical protein
VKRTRSAAPGRSRPARRTGRRPPAALATDLRELEALRQQLARATTRAAPPRWNAKPDDVQRSVMQLVLTLVEFIRRILERQAIRRLESRTLTRKQTEEVGLALMRLEETIHGLATQFGIEPEDLNLELGPLGKLM